MKALVTGGLGFIGSHLVDALLREGHDVTIVDCLLSNAVPPENYARKCNVIICRVEDYTPTDRFDVLFHLASVVGPAGVLPHSGNIGRQMVEGTAKMIDMAVDMGGRLIDVSTSEVYGYSGYLTEDAPKIVNSKVTVRLEYGVGKLLTEIMIENTAKVKPLQWVIIRPFNVAGPRQQPTGGFVTPRFVRAAVRGLDLTIFGTGEQVRAFTHVYDIVEGILLASQTQHVNQIYNLGNPHNKITIREYAELINRLCGNRSRLVYMDGKQIFGPLFEEAFDKLPDSTEAQTLLGWEPKRTLEDIIRDYLADYLSRASTAHNRS
jgi:nucleoside-diphosphate-sugar epimerase